MSFTRSNRGRFDFRRPRTTAERGFTLIEMMISVAIVGMLATVAVPAFQRYIEKARDVEAVEGINKLVQGFQAYYQAHTIMPGQHSGPGWSSGWGFGPTVDQICADGGRATRATVDSVFRSALQSPYWDMLAFFPGEWPRYQYDVWSWTVAGPPHTSFAYIYLTRQSNCGSSPKHMREYRTWLNSSSDGGLRQHGMIERLYKI